MHRLDRHCVPVPPCLIAPDPSRRYAHLHGPEKDEVRAALLEIQKLRCAYCERRTGAQRDDGHIEHFRQQAGHQSMDLTWSNLFWSCQDEKTCGKHKDKCDRPVGSGAQAMYDASDLIDPCHHDPSELLQFLPDGTVRLRDGMDATQEKMALETIRVFQLNTSPFLRKSREDAVRPYMLAINALLAAGLEVVRRYLDSVQPHIDEAPFCTAIHQYLRGLQS